MNDKSSFNPWQDAQFRVNVRIPTKQEIEELIAEFDHIVEEVVLAESAEQGFPEANAVLKKFM